MDTTLYNQKAENIGKIQLPESIFGLKANADLVYQVITSQLSNKRQVIAHAKGRSEVRGGGKKPWKQKGTGRARHGSIRSPIWKGGGVTFGPTKEVNFKKKINKKMARKALFVTLSSKVKDQEIAIIDGINFDTWKTKEMASVIKNLKGLFKGGRTLLIITGSDNNKEIRRVSNNIPGVDVLEAKNLNALNIVSRKNLVLLKDGLDQVQKVFTK